MTKFKVGNKIMALESSQGCYTKGDIYVVRAYNEKTNRVFTELDDVGSITNGWGGDRFELVTEAPAKKLKPLKSPIDSSWGF